MTEANDDLYLGPCCICESDAGVTNILMLHRRCVIPGHGWGCVLCHLPPDGASAVLCGRCCALYRDGRAKLRFACRGYPGTEGRIAIESLPPDGTFGHDPACHPEMMAQGGSRD